MALVLTVLVITILLATAAQLATLSSTRAVINDRHSRTLQHRLAVDSAIELIAQAMIDENGISRALDRNACVEAEFDVGDCQARVSIRDDGAKFNVRPFVDKTSTSLLRRKLQELRRLMRLPDLELDLRPVSASQHLNTGAAGTDPRAPTLVPYVSFDQLFGAPQSPAIFHWDLQDGKLASQPVWSDYVSLFGDGRIDLRRADRQVVALALRDIQSDLAPTGRSASAIQDTLRGVDDAVRPRAAARLGYGLDRYALTVQTAVGADVRRWYVVATLKRGQVATVWSRQQITW